MLKNTIFNDLYLRRINSLKINCNNIIQRYKLSNRWSSTLFYSVKNITKNNESVIELNSDVYLTNEIDSYHEKIQNHFIVNGEKINKLSVNTIYKINSNINYDLMVFTPYDKHGIKIDYNEIPKELIEKLKQITDSNLDFEISSKF